MLTIMIKVLDYKYLNVGLIKNKETPCKKRLEYKFRLHDWITRTKPMEGDLACKHHYDTCLKHGVKKFAELAVQTIEHFRTPMMQLSTA